MGVVLLAGFVSVCRKFKQAAGEQIVMHEKKICKSGFTLVEVMIVVAIVGLLAAIGVRNYISARMTAQRNVCITNLKQLDAAKQQWAADTNQGLTSTPANSDLFGASLYLKTNVVCPTGGSYSLNAVSVLPTCNRSASPDFHTL